ncbi:hypothetical protein ACIHCV_45240 [Streptomyces sp. NPDC051956]|uniref:hypothetical protein n=1 Tax=Streptomyces sp. NPDC051956 TaxID=3365677 RepID=UPI0037CDC6FA
MTDRSPAESFPQSLADLAIHGTAVRAVFADPHQQQVVDPELKIQERDDDLAAARAANRELMTRLNRHRTDQPADPR